MCSPPRQEPGVAADHMAVSYDFRVIWILSFIHKITVHGYWIEKSFQSLEIVKKTVCRSQRLWQWDGADEPGSSWLVALFSTSDSQHLCEESPRHTFWWISYNNSFLDNGKKMLLRRDKVDYSFVCFFLKFYSWVCFLWGNRLGLFCQNYSIGYNYPHESFPIVIFMSFNRAHKPSPTSYLTP